MKSDLERDFDAAMMTIFHRALEEANYRATRFHQMLCDHGGFETARILLQSSKVSEGYTALWERKRLDLTVEALILEPQWHEMFTEEERAKAKKRLEDYGHTTVSGGPARRCAIMKERTGK